MLKPVFARAGSDKNAFLADVIREAVCSSARKTMLIVPEQSSFETEKELYLSLGDRDYARVEVLSFTRLCSLIRTGFGSRSGEKLSAAGKLILASCAAEKAAPSLRVYGGQVSSNAFAQKVSAMIDELKVAGISPDAFEKGLQNFSNNPLLLNKLSDVAWLYHWYDVLLSENYLDPSDELSDAAVRIGDGAFFKNYDIIIDEFASFNASQLGMIAKMLQNSPSVTVLLCSKPIVGGRCPTAFRTPNDTFRKLKQLAARVGTQMKAPLCLKAGELYQNEDMRILEKFAAGESGCGQVGKNITISAACSVKEECRFVAAAIRRLVSEKKMRYRDIAVIGRDMTDYLIHLEDSFRLYNIPFFADRRISLDTRPVVVFIVNLLEVLISDIEPSRLISYLKCGVSPLTADEAVELENYIDLWKLSQKELKNDFEKNPQGLEGEPDEAALERLNYLNGLRKKAVMPLFALKKEIADQEGSSVTRSIYRFMEQNGVLQKLSELTNALSETDSALAAEQYRAYQSCMSVMSQLASLLKGNKISLKRYLELFRLALSSEDVGSIPHHLDEVQVGDAGRIRTGAVKAVFLVGMNEGLFPKRHSEDGLFSDNDRKLVREAGMDILTPANVMNQNESYYLYTALSCASDEVHISYCRNTQAGDAVFASKIVNQIRDTLGVVETDLSSMDQTALLGTDEADFELLCRSYHSNCTFANSLREYFMMMQEDTYRNRLLSIDKGVRLRTSSIGNAAAAKLYGSEMMISPSQIERYHLCRFSHFCRYGLSLRPLKPAEITALDSGNAIHEVLERLLKNYSKEQIALFSEKELSCKVEKMLYEFLSVRIGENAMQDNRIRYSILRLKSTIVPVIGYIIKELAVSGFIPNDFELQIRCGGDLEPYRIISEQGTSIGVYGKVDRVDTLAVDGKTYVRVIDYKSGGKSFDREELAYGINLQMFLYLFSIWENGGKRYGGKVTPSGVLYMPAKRPDIKIDGNEDKGDIKNMQDKEFRMKGLLLSQEPVINENTKRFCSALFGDITEFSAIKKQTEKLLCKMADELRLGELSINPLYSGRENRACKNCDYRMICGFEEGDPHRTMQKIKKSEKEVGEDG